MTDVSTEPVVAPPATPDPNPPTPAQPAPAPQQAAVAHTAGGWPVVPFALTGANATTTLLAGAALAGGPIAAMVAATGAVVLGATAAHRKTKTKPRNSAKTASKTAGRTTAAGTGSGAARLTTRTGSGGGRPTVGRVPSQPKRSTLGGKPGTAGSPGGSLGKSPLGGSTPARTASAQARPASPRGTTATAGSAAPGGRSTAPAAAGKPQATRSGAGSSVKGGKVPGRVGEVRALRQEARAGAPSRAERRTGTTSARRQVADARRDAKQQARTTAAATKGPVGRAVAKGTGAAGKARSAATGRLRKARDEQTAAKVAEQRADVRKAPARKRARKALWKSAARFHGRRLLAAILAGALGIVGMVTTPLGRKLGWAWLQHPGRRLFARLVKQARDQRTARDQAIGEEREADEQAADAESTQDDEQQIGDTAERPGGPVPTTNTSESTEGEGMSGFNFEEHAAEMEAAAQNYEPESAMEILAMVEGLPAALTSIANVMKILAERSDSEFPLEKEVADSFSDMFGAVMSAVAVAEDMGPTFRKAHEQDIARHEDPRNGPEAEKGWNV
ncbi:hypothetical protein [Streptomyces sp. cmx-4-25]|uniref:hypothetical protein n=1 Tax=Streptomyces sp. cmx-4-25 TaxID=2790933 RepID=UPI003980EC9A